MKKIYFAGLLLVFMSLSSCLTIIEEITVRKEGSGSYRLVMDGEKSIQKSRDVWKSEDQPQFKDTTGTVQSSDTDEFATELKRRSDLTAQILGEKKGISNVMGFNDTKTSQSGFSFDFAQVEDLKKAMTSLESTETFGLWDEPCTIDLKGRTLKRRTKEAGFKDFISAETLKIIEESGQNPLAVKWMMKMIFKGLEFKTVYLFPDQKIKKCNDKRAQLSDDRHTLTILEKPFDENNSSDKKPDMLIIRLK